MVAALLPKVPGSTRNGQKYGRYAVRFKADPIDGYKIAWLLWPDSRVWPRDGEIDFPERNLVSDNVMEVTWSSSGRHRRSPRVPNTPMHWVLQTETTLTSTLPSSDRCRREILGEPARPGCRLPRL